jgi:hypothetical protein
LQGICRAGVVSQAQENVTPNPIEQSNRAYPKNPFRLTWKLGYLMGRAHRSGLLIVGVVVPDFYPLETQPTAMNKVTRSVKSRIGSLVVSLGLDKLIPPDEHQLFTHDKDFHTIYENGLRMSGSFNSKRRRPRNYNMIAMFKLTGNLEGRGRRGRLLEGHVVIPAVPLHQEDRH